MSGSNINITFLLCFAGLVFLDETGEFTLLYKSKMI